MSTKRIVVDELPEDGCCECRFSKVFTSKFGNDKVRCVATNKPVSDFAFGYTKQPRSDWCPLEVEEVCEWNGEYGGYDEHGDIIFFQKRQGVVMFIFKKLVYQIIIFVLTAASVSSMWKVMSRKCVTFLVL